ncbi:hypothetical protein ILUMI_10274 [Ignelater luminosus]|uniref:Uncharacterized protein n=1 Tax=Ignelater luminosus TaxID=2038154 RepID=A0A8K0GBM1_IGNLU|nr:hypothetical protein ILUMI_10274 [Ignelater luminosus]
MHCTDKSSDKSYISSDGTSEIPDDESTGDSQEVVPVVEKDILPTANNYGSEQLGDIKKQYYESKSMGRSSKKVKLEFQSDNFVLAVHKWEKNKELQLFARFVMWAGQYCFKLHKNLKPPINKNAFEAAVADFLQNNLSFREAATVHNISRARLMRYVKKYKDSNRENFEYSVSYDIHKVFFLSLLVSHLKQAARLHYGLTLSEVRILAYQYAKANNKKYPDKWKTNKKAGKSWLRGFRKTYDKELSLHKPEATSLARSTGLNKATIEMFFENYKKILKRKDFAEGFIWNCDETRVTTVHNLPKVFAPKGIKQIGSMTSGERGVNVAMIAAISATANSNPPMLIFLRVNFKDFMMKGAPPGAIGAKASSGWSNEVLFLSDLKVTGLVEDHEFLPYITDRPLPDASNTSSDVLSSPASSSRPDTTTISSIISSEILKPFPKSQARKPFQKDRQRRRSRILTDTFEQE